MDKVILKDTEYELIEDNSLYGNETPHIVFQGKRYVGKAITKEQKIEDKYRFDVTAGIVEKRVPMFTTEDFKQVFDKDHYPIYKVDKYFQLLQFSACDVANYPDAKYFYNKTEAENYILINKPTLSLNDLLRVWRENGFENNKLFEKVKEKAKKNMKL